MSTFNPADLLNITLSGGNLIATGNSATNGGVRGTTSHSTGKFTLSFTGVNLSGDSVDYVGIGAASATLGLANSTQPNQIILINTGTTFCPGGISGGVTAFSGAGNAIDYAFDFGAALFWVRVNGSGWSDTGGANTGNPVAGTGGRAMGTMTAALFPYIRLTNTGSTATVNPTLDLSLTGFTPWDGAATPTSAPEPIIIITT